MSVFITIIHFLLDLVFPPSCVSCGRPDALLCAACAITVRGEPQIITVTSVDKTIIATDYQHDAVRQTIKQFKYHNLPQLAQPLAELLISTLTAESPLPDFIVAPIPLHRKRYRQRGYNQSELLAAIVAQHFGWKVMTGLQRVIDTEHQAGLNRLQRLNNLDNAFQYSGPNLKDRHVLLIDDVVTTGTTIQSVAEVLRPAEPAAIWAIAVARNREQDEKQKK
jgi:ComF family protein